MIEIETIHIILLAAYVLLILGFKYREYVFGAIAGILLVVWGIYVIENGLTGLDQWLYEAIAGIHIMLGLYVFLRGTWEVYKDM